MTLILRQVKYLFFCIMSLFCVLFYLSLSLSLSVSYSLLYHTFAFYFAFLHSLFVFFPVNHLLLSFVCSSSVSTCVLCRSFSCSCPFVCFSYLCSFSLLPSNIHRRSPLPLLPPPVPSPSSPPPPSPTPPSVTSSLVQDCLLRS